VAEGLVVAVGWDVLLGFFVEVSELGGEVV
jgi:hypothetical protein